MKSLTYILAFFFLSSCSTAQNFKLVEADHTVSIGGVRGARAEIINLRVKENSKLKVKYLLIGNVKIDLIQKTAGGILHLKGQYFPENTENIILNENPNSKIMKDDFDLEKVYLVSENIITKKEIVQKINIPESSEKNESMPLGDVPQ